MTAATQSRDQEPSRSKYRFSGHESFPFRYTWLAKGVRALYRTPDLFTRQEALVSLGVGKNMVKSIRHWCEVLGLIERVDRTGRMRVTTFGSALFGKKGWDPYLENPGTLWLLQWQLASRREHASTWYLVFSAWKTELFTRNQLTEWLVGLVRRLPAVRATPTSLRRDVEVFLRTYVPTTASRDIPLEDTFDCPLVELGLLREVERGLYRLGRGSRASLPYGIFLYALTDYWERTTPLQETLPFETILEGPGSPGCAFSLSETPLVGLLERLPRWSGMLYDETAGVRSVLQQDAGHVVSPMDALERFYTRQA